MICVLMQVCELYVNINSVKIVQLNILKMYLLRKTIPIFASKVVEMY